MQIRKRWPFLFAAGSALIYLGNHYHIAGLEHLRLVARPSALTADRIDMHVQGNFGPGNYGPSNYGPSNYGPSNYGPSNYGSGNQESTYASHPAPFPSTSRATSPGFSAGGQTGQPAGVAANIFDHLPPWESKLSVGEKLAVMQENLTQKISSMVQSPSPGGSTFPINAPIPLPAELEMIRPDSPGNANSRSTSSLAGSKAAAWTSIENVPRIRIASFNAQPLDSVKLAKANVAEALISILGQFDLIALQGIQSERDDILPNLVEGLSRSGRKFDYLIGPRVGKGSASQQYAFLFCTTRVETDRYQLYTVDDPENLMTYDPLVAWFRCKDFPADEAFTFSLVNLRISPEAAAAEQAYLPNLIHAVVHDGRSEDDVLVAGDFAGNACQIPGLNKDSIRFAVRDMPNDTAGTAMLSSILFSAQGTVEYSGRGGTFDFLRKFNLPIEKALEVSQQMPIWAEYYAAEGAQPGRVAPANAASAPAGAASVL